MNEKDIMKELGMLTKDEKSWKGNIGHVADFLKSDENPIVCIHAEGAVRITRKALEKNLV